jgi:diadenosine tetraphosphate (Ap4A) HIT family hydrolase
MSDGRLAALRRGEKPADLLAETASGFAVFGDHQKLPGYCLLIHRGEVEHLTDLGPAERTAFLEDMALLGQAAFTVLSGEPGFRRLNYEVLGNSWPHLHAHVHPRYEWEPADYRSRPVWRYPDLEAEEHRSGQAHAELRERIALELKALLIGGA